MKNKIDMTGKEAKEVRKALRTMPECSTEIVLGNYAILKMGDHNYARRQKDDKADYGTDYSPYYYNLGEKNIIERALREGAIRA